METSILETFATSLENVIPLAGQIHWESGEAPVRPDKIRGLRPPFLFPVTKSHFLLTGFKFRVY